MDKKTEYWIELSEYDIDTAVAMLETKRFLYVGFMCHQAVEKALKAVMVSKNKELPPKIHNLIRLAENADLLDYMNDFQKKTIFTLNPLNIESRYPSYKEKLLAQMTTDTCTQILNNTKELLVWIKAQL